MISGAASKMHDLVECRLCDGCQESKHISKALVPSSASHRDFTYAAVYTCDLMISSISSETLLDNIFMMARKNLMHNRRDYRIVWESPYFLVFVVTNMHCARCVTLVVSDTEASELWMKTTWGRNLAMLCFLIWCFYFSTQRTLFSIRMLGKRICVTFDQISCLIKRQSHKVSTLQSRSLQGRQSRWAQQHSVVNIALISCQNESSDSKLVVV